MRLLCRSGHFAFYPRYAEDLEYMRLKFDVELVSDQDFYTFAALKDAPRYSLVAAPYINLPATKTFEGRGPWDVMRENGFTYSLAAKMLVPKEVILSVIEIPRARMYGVKQGLIQPGSLLSNGFRVMSYDAEFDMVSNMIYVREIKGE
jgi:hypothetical protein